ncbi:MAG: RidA family protein [Candidatus Eisenbacteria bacterium]
MRPTGRRNIASPSPWEPKFGYSRAVRIGPWVLVAGTTGSDGEGRAIGGDDAYAQARAALDKIETALTEAGATLEHVVRTRIYVTRIADFEAVARAHGERFGSIRPASTLVEVSALVSPALIVEIEADAYVGERA